MNLRLIIVIGGNNIMEQYIPKAAVVSEIERLHKENSGKYGCNEVAINLEHLEDFLDTLESKESDETAEAFARIIRANLTGIDKDVQYKFEQLYKEITGEKMYQGYND